MILLFKFFLHLHLFDGVSIIVNIIIIIITTASIFIIKNAKI